MRKRIIQQDAEPLSAVERNWLDLKRLEQVELTSEDATYPIERSQSVARDLCR